MERVKGSVHEVSMAMPDNDRGLTYRQHGLPDAVRDFLQVVKLYPIPYDGDDICLRKSKW